MAAKRTGPAARALAMLGREKIPRSRCPECRLLATRNPCEHCNMRIAPAAIRKGH